MTVLMMGGIPRGIEVVRGIVVHTETLHHRLGRFVASACMGHNLGKAIAGLSSGPAAGNEPREPGQVRTNTAN
jgi:hypothetical protein